MPEHKQKVIIRIFHEIFLGLSKTRQQLVPVAVFWNNRQYPRNTILIPTEVTMMKRVWPVMFIFLFLLFGAVSASGTDKTVRVRTKQGHIRESDRFYSQVKATAGYDEILQVLDKKNEWIRVKYKDLDGWIHSSSVSEKEKMKYTPVMLGSDIDPESGGDNHEVALAGKGFTPEVEKKMGENDPDLNYALVDEITQRETSADKLHDFVKEGRLKYPE